MDYRQVPVDFDPFADQQDEGSSWVSPADAALPPPEPLVNREPPALSDDAGAGAPREVLPSRQTGTFKEVPVDFDPFAPAYKPKDDYAITRGAKVAYEQGAQATGIVADMERWSRMEPEQAKAEMLKPVVQDPGQPQMQVPSLSDIGSKQGYISDTATFIGESIGQMIGSVGAAMVEGGAPAAAVGGAIGAGVGATAMGVGALPGGVLGAGAGATSGTAAHFVVQGIAGTYQDLMSDPGVRKRLESGELTPNDILFTATGLGSVIGAIDIIPEAKLFTKFGGKEVSKELIKKSLTKAVVAGAGEQAVLEGGTEGLQGAISEVGQAALGKDVNLGQRVMSVIDQAAAGAFGGMGPGGVAGGVENARIPGPDPSLNTEFEIDYEAGTAKPSTRTGVATPPNNAGGQSTPGGVPAGATPPPKPAATANTAVVIPPGTVDPTLAAATSEIPGAAPLAPPGVVAPAVGEVPTRPAVDAPPVVAPVAEEEDVGDEADPDEEVIPVAAPEAQSMREKINAILNAKKAEQTVAGPPNADLQAALTNMDKINQSIDARAAHAIEHGLQSPPQGVPQVAGVATPPSAAPGSAPVLNPPTAPQVQATVPPPAPQVAPAVMSPEPIGTAAAAARRAAPQSLPVEAAPPAPAPFDNASAPTGQVIATPVDYDPFAGEPVQTLQVQPSVPAQPVASFATAPQPAAVAPKITPIGRMLADRVRQELANDIVTESPGYHEAVDEVAAELTADRPKGTSPARVVEQHFTNAVAAVKERLGAREAERTTKAAEQERALTESAMTRAKEAQRARETSGTPQERKRTGKVKGKKSQELRDEKNPATFRAYQRELKKPEAERDPDIIEWGEAYTARSAFPKRGAEASRTVHTQRMADAQQRRIAREEAEEAKTARPEPAKPGQEVVPGTTEGAPTSKDVYVSDQMEARNRAVGPIVGKAFTEAVEPDFSKMTSMQALNAKARDYIRSIYTKVVADLKAAGIPRLHENISRKYSLEENMMIFARKVLGNKRTDDGPQPVEFISALTFARDGRMDDVFDILASDMVGGSQLEGNEQGIDDTAELQELRDSYDEGSNQFLAIKANEISEDATLQVSQAQRSAMDPEGRKRILTYAPGGGKPDVSFTAERSEIGADVLRDAYAAARRQVDVRKLSKIVQKMHAKLLRQLVGKTPVVFVSGQTIVDMTGDSRVNAFYSNPSNKTRLTGDAGTIYIDNDNWVAAGPAERAHIIAHEMTHAATAYALNHNLRGTATVISRLRIAMKRQVEARGIDTGLWQAFDDNHEFVAEAFSNPVFQEMLADAAIPPALAREISGMLQGRPAPTWWQAFVDAVRNAINLFDRFAGRASGPSFLESVIAVHPSLVMSAEAQERAAANLDQGNEQGRISQMARKLQERRAQPRGPFDILPMRQDMKDGLEAMKGRAGFRWYNRGARFLSTAATTTEEMKRNWVAKHGTPGDAFEKLANLFLSQRKKRNDYREAGDRLTVELSRFIGEDSAQALAMTNLLYDATLAQVDPSSPLGSPSNGHISKAGLNDTWRRAAHRRLAGEWAKLSPAAKTLARKLTAHYSKLEGQRIELLVRNIIQQSMRPKENGGFGVVLPQGKTLGDAIAWAMSPAIDRTTGDPAVPKSSDRTAEDDAWHKALGKTAESLQGTHKMRKIAGTYVPLVRWGKYFFSATHKVSTPAGAVADPAAKDGNAFYFFDKKDLKAFQDTTDEQIDRVVPEWYDPLTLEKTQKQNSRVDPNTGLLVDPKPRWRVTIQNRTMIMDDSQGKLARRREEFGDRRQWNEPSQIAMIDSVMHGNSEIVPKQLNRLINNIRQSTEGAATVGQQANINAVVDAYIRQLSGSRAAHRRLKRASVGGYSRDLVHSTLTSNRTMAGHLANLETSAEMASLDNDLTKLVDKGRYASDPSGVHTLERQGYIKELRRRIETVATRNEDNFGTRLMNAAMDMSFMTHLFTLSYTAMNLAQPFATTYPVLATDHGDGATLAQMGRAYRDLGALRTVGLGLKETGREAVLTGRRAVDFGKKVASGKEQPMREDVQFNHHDDAARRMKGKPDAALFTQFLDRLDELGFGAASGVETADLHEIKLSSIERGVARSVRVARAMAEAAEAVNRHTTGLAALRLAKRKGLTDAQAIDYAVTTVEKTQGGYASENNPTWMSGKWARLPLQFKKYSVMYAQLYYGALSRSLNTSNDRATRVAAAKGVARLSAVMVLMAGATGLAPLELARGLVLAANLFGLTDDDWETWENDLQGWLADAFKWATGSGDFGAEVVMRGASRMLGVDTSSRLGASSMALFGEPRTMDAPGIKSWLLDMLVGAPGGMINDALIEGKLPYPKFIKDLQKAGEEEGVYDKIVQGAGFRTAAAARKWETGGEGSLSKEEKKLRVERTTLMGKYADAKGAARLSIWSHEIAAWNRAHRDKKMKIEFGDLRRSINTRKQKAKERAAAN